MTLELAQAVAAAPDDSYLLWGFILAGGAMGILLLEFLIPSGGLLGLLCGLSGIGSIVFFFMYDTRFGVAAVIGYAILTPIVLVFGFKLWINSPLARRMVLGGDVEGNSDGPPDTPGTSGHARSRWHEELRQLIGVQGVTITALRPVGVVKINGRRVDAMAESGIVEANTPVVVTDVYDNQIKVKACSPQASL